MLNDVYLVMDYGHCVVLVLLDSTAAFDTVGHQILLSRLERRAGIQGCALEWFRFYLKHRSFSVCIESVESSTVPFKHEGAPGLHSWPSAFLPLSPATWVHPA